MKHSFTSTRDHCLEVRESGRSTKLFLKINPDSSLSTFKRIDDQPLKPAIVTSLLQEIIKLKVELDQSRDNVREAWHVAAQNERISKEVEEKYLYLTSEP